MKKLLPIGTLGLAGLVGAGVITFPGAVTAADDTDEVVAKREDNVAETVLVADDDEDDTKDRPRSRGTGDSRSRDDNTRSLHEGQPRP